MHEVSLYTNRICSCAFTKTAYSTLLVNLLDTVVMLQLCSSTSTVDHLNHLYSVNGIVTCETIS